MLSTCHVVQTVQPNFKNFLCTLPSVTVARSSSDSIAIHYVLPVLWMTSCFHTMVPMVGGWTGTTLCSSPAPVDVVAARMQLSAAHWLAGSAGRFAGAHRLGRVRSVCRLDWVAADDSGARFSVSSMYNGDTEPCGDCTVSLSPFLRTTAYML